MITTVALLFALHLAPESADSPLKQPQLAVSSKMTALTFGSGNAIYFASSADSGKTFSKAVKVAEPGVLSLGNHRGPRVAITPSAIVISAIAGTVGKGQDGDLLAWRSTDGGKTWSKSIRINDVPAAPREGLHAMTAKGDTVFAAWLDLREKGMKLYSSVSNDGGAHWSENRLVYASPDGHICECCHPSAVIGPNGEIYAMWRNWLGGSRDMYVAVSRDGGKTFRPEKQGSGTWPLNACPMDGGGLLLDKNGKVESVWRRDDSVYLASKGSESVLAKGKNPAVVEGPDGVYAAWNQGMDLMLKTPGAPEPKVIAHHAGFASLAAGPTVVIAWEEHGGSIVVEPVQ